MDILFYNLEGIYARIKTFSLTKDQNSFVVVDLKFEQNHDNDLAVFNKLEINKKQIETICINKEMYCEIINDNYESLILCDFLTKTENYAKRQKAIKIDKNSYSSDNDAGGIGFSLIKSWAKLFK
jgi:hypothetical protein